MSEDLSLDELGRMLGCRIPIRAARQIDELDTAEVIEGYEAGRDGDPEPGDNRSYSFWHGWRNGSVDGGHRAKDQAGAALASDIIASGWLESLGK